MNTRDHDELLSAYIDGLTTPDENRRVESDPGLAARAEAMRSAARLAATPVPDDDEVAVDAAVATALSHSTTAANVTALRPGARSRRRLAAIGAAAAAVAVVFLAGALLLSLDDGNGDDDDLAAELNTAQDSAQPLTEEAAVGEDSGTLDAPSAGAAEDRAATEAAEEAAGADGDAEPESDASMADMESTDDAADEAAAPTAEASLPLFATGDALVAAVEAGELPVEFETVALPCDIELDASAEVETPAVVFARLPDGAVIVTGTITGSGFEVDRVVRMDDCTTLVVSP